MKMISYTANNFRKIEHLKYVTEEDKNDIEIVSKVLPFKTNNYVTDYLIDWKSYKTDPLYILNFPNRRMLREEHFEKVKHAVSNSYANDKISSIINEIRQELNPHPAEQLSNIPTLDGIPLNGVQHKYEDIVLFFPSQGQTCHAHCTFCFRWPQFVKDLDLQFSMTDINPIIKYIRRNEQINEILFTGGDPMVMTPTILKKYIDAIFEAKIPHLKNIRFGSKSLTFWPFKFIASHDDKAKEMLQLFKSIVDNGYHLSFMAHFNHPNELGNEIVEEAIHNIQSTGAQIRTQAPVLRNINDSSEIWAKMWTRQVELGLVPYYMFIERETGPFNYFQIPLKEVYQIYSDAIRQAGSLAKTVTGPVMSTKQGKVQILDILKMPFDREKYFMMNFIRHRDRNKTYKPFLAEFKDDATWFDQVKVIENEGIYA